MLSKMFTWGVSKITYYQDFALLIAVSLSAAHCDFTSMAETMGL